MDKGKQIDNPRETILEAMVMGIASPEPRKRGRPEKYDASMIETMLEAMALGATDVQIMARLGICRDTFYRWLRENEDFKKAHDQGLAASESFWETLGKLGMVQKGFNAQIYLSFMGNKFGWSKSTNSDSPSNTINIGKLTVNNVQSLSLEELQDKIALHYKNLGEEHPELLPKDITPRKEDDTHGGE